MGGGQKSCRGGDGSSRRKATKNPDGEPLPLSTTTTSTDPTPTPAIDSGPPQRDFAVSRLRFHLLLPPQSQCHEVAAGINRTGIRTGVKIRNGVGAEQRAVGGTRSGNQRGKSMPPSTSSTNSNPIQPPVSSSTSFAALSNDARFQAGQLSGAPEPGERNEGCQHRQLRFPSLPSSFSSSNVGDNTGMEVLRLGEYDGETLEAETQRKEEIIPPSSTWARWQSSRTTRKHHHHHFRFPFLPSSSYPSNPY